MAALGGLVSQIRHDYPDIKIVHGQRFLFRPPRTVVIGSTEGDKDSLLFLHEVGHALIGRYDYHTGVERLRIEVLAWAKARKLCDQYGIEVDEDFIETELDSYRDWLHQKSRCPKCGLTRFQRPDGRFLCPKCDLSA